MLHKINDKSYIGVSLDDYLDSEGLASLEARGLVTSSVSDRFPKIPGSMGLMYNEIEIQITQEGKEYIIESEGWTIT